MPPPPPFPGMNKKLELPNYLEPKDDVVIDQRAKMKTIHWKAIEPKKIPESSIWVKCQGSKIASEKTLADLKDKFPLKLCKEKVQLQSRLNTKKVIDLKVVNVKSAQNILISLRTLLKNQTHDQIKNSILQCDVLELDDIQNLIQYLPSPGEIKKLVEINMKGDELSDVEKFLATLGEIHDLVPRLHSMVFKLHAIDDIKDINRKIKTVNAACEEITNSEKFVEIHKLILELGNHMNSGSKDGQAYGFEISSLSKLIDMKDSSNKKSFLHFVVETIDEKFPELLDFGEELPHIEEAAHIHLKRILDIMDKMKKSLDQLNWNLTKFKSNRSLNENDKFVEKMTDFALGTDALVNEVMEMIAQMKDRYMKVTEYFALDPKDYPYEKFFGEIRNFKEMFVRARKENAVQKTQRRLTDHQTKIQSQNLEASALNKIVTTRQVNHNHETHDQTQIQSHTLKDTTDKENEPNPNPEAQEKIQIGTKSSSTYILVEGRKFSRDVKVSLTTMSKTGII